MDSESWLNKKMASLKHTFSVFKKRMNILFRIVWCCFLFVLMVELTGFEIAFYIFTRILIIVILIRGICSLLPKSSKNPEKLKLTAPKKFKYLPVPSREKVLLSHLFSFWLEMCSS